MGKGLFFIGLLLAASGLLSPAAALALGVGYAFLFANPYQAHARRYSKVLLQVAVIAIGFGMNFGQVLRAGRSGFLYTALGIAAAMILGWTLGRAMRVGGVPSFLITAGTAICGGRSKRSDGGWRSWRLPGCVRRRPGLGTGGTGSNII